MKTLKQQLQENDFLGDYITPYEQPAIKQILETIKEWLTQKRQEIEARPIKFRNPPTVTTALDELLEELNQ